MISIDAPPLVSVVMPAFNCEATLQASIDSVIEQSMCQWELIIVDDGSADGTWSIIERNIERDRRLRGIRHVPNSGLPAVARNVGLQSARGAFVAFLDSDDRWWRHHLQRHLENFHRNPEIAMSFSHLWTQRKGRPLWGLLYLPGTREQRAKWPDLLRRNSIQCSSVVIRTEVIREAGGFSEDPRLRAVEDYELWLRVSRNHELRFLEGLTGVYADGSGISRLEDMETRLNSLANILNAPIVRRKPAHKLMERLRSLPSAVVSVGRGLRT